MFEKTWVLHKHMTALSKNFHVKSIFPDILPFEKNCFMLNLQPKDTVSIFYLIIVLFEIEF